METLNQASLADGTVSGSVPHASYQIRVPDTDDENHYIVRSTRVAVGIQHLDVGALSTSHARYTQPREVVSEIPAAGLEPRAGPFEGHVHLHWSLIADRALIVVVRHSLAACRILGCTPYCAE